ncbi:hypothetical protein [Rubrivivax gelatinosus]|uniref:hypothetical protein n=1 Tax=Rubrivivax gelatinosus TaxID=28068 RepID=UPI0019031DE5
MQMQNIVDKAWNGAVIIRKIHGADAEQYAGLGQVNRSVPGLDGEAQRNAEQAEEAAAAGSLQERLEETMRGFRLADSDA